MKKLLIAISIFFVGSFSALYAQQRAQYSNYVMNNYILNPAVAGSYTYWNAKVGHREQWLGLEGAPKTSFFSVHGAIGHPEGRRNRWRKTGHHGIGAYAYYDRLGPLSWSGAFFSYAYHVPMTRKITTSFGAFAGMKEFKVDGDDINFVQHEDDLLVKPGVQSTIIPDVNLGVFTYSEDFFVGVSMHQVIGSSLDFETKNGVTPDGKLHNHYFFTGGYKMSLSRKWHFFPTVMVKAMYPAPLTFDVNLRMMYNDNIWFGVSYRDRDAVVAMVEYVYDNKFEIGYSYDLGLSRLRAYHTGTHEIILGIRWNDLARTVHCPAKFW